jgi:predicted RecA/RadA family phage recombinase
MAYTQTAEFELASEQYIELQDTTDGSTTYSEGELILLNNCLGFCITDVAVSTKFAAVIQCEKVNALKVAETMSAGQKLYWKNGTSNVTVTDTSAGLPPVGYVLEDTASGATTVTMAFDARGQASLTVAT